MALDPEKHHRRSIRLKDYDYSQAGLYFITICVTDMECFFGVVVDGKMVLNAAGKMIEKWYRELAHKFPDIEPSDFVVMPNHFHAIIINKGNAAAVGADLRVRPTDAKTEHLIPNGGVLGEHIGSPLHRVVQWFKTMSTNEYIRGVKDHGWPRFLGKLWQRNYYEHIIRSQRSFQNISGYIENNPEKWEDDRFYRNQ